MPRVLIAVDGTDLDHHLGAAAATLFGPDALLFAINVGDSPQPVFMPAPGFGYAYAVVQVDGRLESPTSDPAAGTTADSEVRDEARDVAAAASPDDAVPIGEVGDPVERIVASAEQIGADVIVVGTHERGWWSRLIDPSVSEGVLRASPVPVLLVHPS